MDLKAQAWSSSKSHAVLKLNFSFTLKCNLDIGMGFHDKVSQDII